MRPRSPVPSELVTAELEPCGSVCEIQQDRVVGHEVSIPLAMPPDGMAKGRRPVVTTPVTCGDLTTGRIVTDIPEDLAENRSRS
jgi:hypothetical protein